MMVGTRVVFLLALVVASSSAIDISRLLGITGPEEVKEGAPVESSEPGEQRQLLQQLGQIGAALNPLNVVSAAISALPIPSLPPVPHKTVTKSIYIQVTSTLTRYPVCMTAYGVLPPCGALAIPPVELHPHNPHHENHPEHNPHDAYYLGQNHGVTHHEVAHNPHVGHVGQRPKPEGYYGHHVDHPVQNHHHEDEHEHHGNKPVHHQHHEESYGYHNQHHNNQHHNNQHQNNQHHNNQHHNNQHHVNHPVNNQHHHENNYGHHVNHPVHHQHHHGDDYGHYRDNLDDFEESYEIKPTAAVRMPEATAMPELTREKREVELSSSSLNEEDSETEKPLMKPHPRYIAGLGAGLLAAPVDTVTKTLYMTKVERYTDHHVTATLVASNCIPEHVPFCPRHEPHVVLPPYLHGAPAPEPYKPTPEPYKPIPIHNHPLYKSPELVEGVKEAAPVTEPEKTA